jgi:hypothetical protein
MIALVAKTIASQIRKRTAAEGNKGRAVFNPEGSCSRKLSEFAVKQPAPAEQAESSARRVPVRDEG